MRALFIAIGLFAFISISWSETLRIKITENDRLVPCRIHLKNEAGKVLRAENLPFWNDHFVCPGEALLMVTPGTYHYEIERGPEYSRNSGSIEVREKQEVVLHKELRRIVELSKEGWWSGELHVHRKLEDVSLNMQAEDLHVGAVITWWNAQNQWKQNPIPENHVVRVERNSYYHILGGEDERGGGALLYFHLPEPLLIQGASREHPSPLDFVETASKHENVWIDIEKPFWWDMPTWVADGRINSIGIANNHMQRSTMMANEAWGRARDLARFPGPHGNGYWTQEIYYQLLNCGLRVPPSAGSASGVLQNPVGYNRVYVYVDKPFYIFWRNLNYETWWQNLKRGRSFVSNGPLLRCEADGELPGHVFRGKVGAKLRIPLKARIDSLDEIEKVEIIQNGRVTRRLTYDEWKTKGLGEVVFDQSGWFLVRAIAHVPHTFRFASTAPFYVEIGRDQPAISRESAQFFVDWVRERMNNLALPEGNEKESVLRWHRKAEQFWLAKVNAANRP